LGLLSLAGMAEKHGHKVAILDLSFSTYDYRKIRDRIFETKPTIVGMTVATPFMHQARDLSLLVKSISKDILVCAGGPHITALPEVSMKESMLDIAVVGEGERTFAEICDGKALRDIKGIYYREDGKVLSTSPRPFMKKLDELPFPAYHLYDSQKYKYRVSRLIVRKRPAGMLEFSRGCIYKCEFCASKNTMAFGLRKKSPQRCAEEVVLLRKNGFREFMVADDIFTSDRQWAVDVCEAILDTGLRIPWSCLNGIRVDSANDRVFRAMAKAGCYRVSFGFESGDETVLRKFGKGGRASLEKGRIAVRKARKAGIEINGFFLLGLSADTEKSMDRTITYARSLPLDMLKFGVTVGYPGTEMFQNYYRKKLIKSFDWGDYNMYTSKRLFAHKNLDYSTISKYMEKAYRRAIVLNFSFIRRRILRSLKTHEFLWDIYYFLKFILMPSTNRGRRGTAKYFAIDKWPKYDFQNEEIKALSEKQ